MQTGENGQPGPVYDRERFLKGVGGDVPLARELLAAYVEDAPGRLAALDAAMQASDATLVVKWAHSIKGMTGVLRATELTELALAMEKAGRGDDLAAAVSLYPRFRELFGQVMGEASAHLQELGGGIG